MDIIDGLMFDLKDKPEPHILYEKEGKTYCTACGEMRSMDEIERR